MLTLHILTAHTLTRVLNTGDCIVGILPVAVHTTGHTGARLAQLLPVRSASIV